METRPLVSVIIAAYKAPEYLRQAVDSVIRQTFGDYEIIVVDDCSGNDYTSQYRLPQGATLICHTERFGAAAAARNTGIRAARGKYVAFLDQDDVWLPEKLAAQVKALEENLEAGLVFCHYRVVDDNLQSLGGETRPRSQVPNPLKQLIRGCFIRTPSAVLVRRDVLIDCGMMDEAVVGASDWDLYLRVARQWGFVAIPEPLVLYRMHPEQLHRHKPLMRKATIVIMEKTLAWARAERPWMVCYIRRCYCRLLRQMARARWKEECEPGAALETLKRAMAIWPWSPRTYGLWVKIVLDSCKQKNKGESDCR